MTSAKMFEQAEQARKRLKERFAKRAKESQRILIYPFTKEHTMFGSLGFTELILILFIVLIIFGAGKLPQLGEGIGKAIKGFKKSVHEADAIEAEAQARPAADGRSSAGHHAAPAQATTVDQPAAVAQPATRGVMRFHAATSRD